MKEQGTCRTSIGLLCSTFGQRLNAVMNTTQRRCGVAAILTPSYKCYDLALFTSSLKLTYLYSDFFSSLVHAPLRTVMNRWPQKAGSAASLRQSALYAMHEKWQSSKTEYGLKTRKQADMILRFTYSNSNCKVLRDCHRKLSIISIFLNILGNCNLRTFRTGGTVLRCAGVLTGSLMSDCGAVCLEMCGAENADSEYQKQ